MQTVTLKKDGQVKTVVWDKENIFCMETAGWVLVDERPAPVAVPAQSATIPAQIEPVKRSPGRPRKEVPSILNGE